MSATRPINRASGRSGIGSAASLESCSFIFTLISSPRGGVRRFVVVFFLPVFQRTGPRTDSLGPTGDIDWLAIVLMAAILGKIVPLYIPARASDFTTNESMTLGALMNTRAVTELIVLNVDYDLGFFLPPSDFAVPVLMVVFNTLMTEPLLEWLLPRVGHTVGKQIEA